MCYIAKWNDTIHKFDLWTSLLFWNNWALPVLSNCSLFYHIIVELQNWLRCWLREAGSSLCASRTGTPCTLSQGNSNLNRQRSLTIDRIKEGKICNMRSGILPPLHSLSCSEGSSEAVKTTEAADHSLSRFIYSPSSINESLKLLQYKSPWEFNDLFIFVIPPDGNLLEGRGCFFSVLYLQLWTQKPGKCKFLIDTVEWIDPCFQSVVPRSAVSGLPTRMLGMQILEPYYY